ncbi:CidA/LrgA family protein [Fusobacterium sp. PH5-44]|uniref:CidA/LrgA family protein n=1 Tax=unclassified Fusobacterium TaxID=2648384 RepID=UPI003D1A3F98
MQSLLIILAINYLGVVLTETLHLPIPGNVLGMILLFIVLFAKILKFDLIKDSGNFLLANMVVFFIPSTVGIIKDYHQIQNDLLKILLIIFISTIITMVITGRVVQFIIKKGGRK